MTIHTPIDFTGLLTTDLQQACENEFQKQMHQSDGEIFVWSKDHFANTDLSIPSPQAQAVLQFFANCGCPITGVKLAISLYPYTSNVWPIKSPYLSFRYLFSAVEIILNIRSDERMKGFINKFEQSVTFKQAMHIAQIMLSESTLVSNICPEVISYVCRLHDEPTNLQ